MKRPIDIQVGNLYESGHSTREIAAILGRCHSGISWIVKKLGISRARRIRTHILQNKALKCDPFSSELKNYLDGLIISDGCVCRPRGVALSSYYRHSSVCKEWLDAIKVVFDKNKIVCNVKQEVRVNRPSISASWALSTYSYDQFFHYRLRWYKEGVKRVPHDIDLSNTQLLKNWIYGDGTLCGSTLRLCTDSFTIEDIDFLIFKFAKQLKFHFKKVRMGLTKQGETKHRLSLCKRDGLIDFLKYVGEPEINFFQYKWFVNG